MLFNKIIGALVTALLYNGKITKHDDSIQFVIRQINRMPDFMYYPFKTLTVFFDFYTILFLGYPFHRLDLSTRKCLVDNLSKSKINLIRDFLKLFKSLTIISTK